MFVFGSEKQHVRLGLNFEIQLVNVDAFAQSISIPEGFQLTEMKVTNSSNDRIFVVSVAVLHEQVGLDLVFEKAVWTIPAERMKADRPHRIPLAPELINILKEIKNFNTNPISCVQDQVCSLQMSLNELLKPGRHPTQVGI